MDVESALFVCTRVSLIFTKKTPLERRNKGETHTHTLLIVLYTSSSFVSLWPAMHSTNYQKTYKHTHTHVTHRIQSRRWPLASTCSGFRSSVPSLSRPLDSNLPGRRVRLTVPEYISFGPFCREIRTVRQGSRRLHDLSMITYYAKLYVTFHFRIHICFVLYCVHIVVSVRPLGSIDNGRRLWSPREIRLLPSPQKRKTRSIFNKSVFNGLCMGLCIRTVVGINP